MPRSVRLANSRMGVKPRWKAWLEGCLLCRMLGCGRPQEGTVMILGRGEKFLSWVTQCGEGREGHKDGHIGLQIPSGSTPLSLASHHLEGCVQTPQSNASSFHCGESRTWAEPRRACALLTHEAGGLLEPLPTLACLGP